MHNFQIMACSLIFGLFLFIAAASPIAHDKF